MKDIKAGDVVIVPEPSKKDDIHSHSFLGTVKAIVATVEDQDGNCFDIDVSRLGETGLCHSKENSRTS